MINLNDPATGLILLVHTTNKIKGREKTGLHPHIIQKIAQSYRLTPTTSSSEIKGKRINVELTEDDGLAYDCCADISHSFMWNRKKFEDYIRCNLGAIVSYLDITKVIKINEKYNALMATNNGGNERNDKIIYKQNTFWFDKTSGRKVKVLSNNWNNAMNDVLIIADVGKDNYVKLNTSRRADKSRLTKLFNNFIVNI